MMDDDERAAVSDALLTASKPELLDADGDRTLRGLLYDFFAFGRSLEDTRAKFASYAGLSPTQYLIMTAIKNSTLDEPMGINQVAARLRLSGAFITNEVGKLVAEGLIEKSAHPSDGRRVQLTATEKGFGLLTRLAAFQRPVNDALFGTLTRDEFRSLSQLLARLAAGGDRAVTFAEFFKASITQEHLQVAAAGAETPEPRHKQSRRRHAPPPPSRSLRGQQ
ncbi:MAG: winged helix-turn-helix transcriptional regulator [Proteobacteria bacterium]|nr:winged helix-turn-helix transcriptional regulator [Pseudomonadota bacterium]